MATFSENVLTDPMATRDTASSSNPERKDERSPPRSPADKVDDSNSPTKQSRGPNESSAIVGAWDTADPAYKARRQSLLAGIKPPGDEWEFLDHHKTQHSPASEVSSTGAVANNMVAPPLSISQRKRLLALDSLNIRQDEEDEEGEEPPRQQQQEVKKPSVVAKPAEPEKLQAEETPESSAEAIRYALLNKLLEKSRLDSESSDRS